MILFDFRYQDPWAEDTNVFPNFIEQTQSRQRHNLRIIRSVSLPGEQWHFPFR